MIRPCRAFFMSKVFRGRVLRTQKLEFLSVENPELSRAFEEFARLEPGVCCNAALHALPTAKECRPVYFFPLLLLLFVCLFVFYNCIVPMGVLPQEKSGCFPRQMPAATKSRYSTYGACWVFYFLLLHPFNFIFPSPVQSQHDE